jgi:hypothetical protein
MDGVTSTDKPARENTKNLVDIYSNRVWNRRITALKSSDFKKNSSLRDLSRLTTVTERRCAALYMQLTHH